jgi:hypothetical protein
MLPINLLSIYSGLAIENPDNKPSKDPIQNIVNKAKSDTYGLGDKGNKSIKPVNLRLGNNTLAKKLTAK